ncbi:PAS domain-containing sensor histidine kinase [Pseudomonas sp. ODNR1LW]|nr:PAS domain-containing sensor histidine kinase [Pseudomonas sp. ODNR1LW]
MEAFAQSILMDAPMAIVAIDLSGKVCCANRTAERFFGRPLLLPPADICDLIEDFDREMLQSSAVVEAINAWNKSSGKNLYRLARCAEDHAFVDLQATLFSKNGQDMVTLFIQDMTASVTTDAALHDVKLQIIHGWRLNSLGEVASMLAHELNQPLGAAINYLAAADSALNRNGAEISNACEMMRSARGQVERATDIIVHLRSLLTDDKGFHVRQRVADVIDEIMPILRAHASEAGAEVVVRVNAEDFVCCDRVQLQQVILNLARNAMDAPQTGVFRQVEISGRPRGGEYIMTVSDNGPGVAPQMADKLFEPLVSSKPGGMGLGLSICRTIVEAHGGSISLSPSRLGGAAFTFTLNTAGLDGQSLSDDQTPDAPFDPASDRIVKSSRLGA